MNKIDFFTPVVFTNSSKSSEQFLLEAVDSYFYLGGKKAEVFPNSLKNGTELVYLAEKKSSFWAAALKVASYCTLILPLLALAVKAVLRSKHHFADAAAFEAPAATKIQAFGRIVLAKAELSKLKRHYLSFDLFEKAKAYCGSLTILRGLPRAMHGKTDVYLPKDLPVVLKCSGGKESKERLEKMGEARTVCEQSGYKKLVIPKARIHGEMLIESRLPISAHDFKEQMGLYVENLDLFNSAVREFTGFCCRVSLTDLVAVPLDDSLYYYEELSQVPMGRYDNVPVFIEDGEGKIGLIDLESLEPLPTRSIETQNVWDEHIKRSCSDIICLFPYHFDAILEEAAKVCPEIEDLREFLEEVRSNALKRFELTYVGHKQCVQSKGITLQNPHEFVRREIREKEKLENAVRALLEEKLLSEGFETAFSEFKEQVLLAALDAAYAFISALLTSNLANQAEITSWEQLLLGRSLEFNEHFEQYEVFYKAVLSRLDTFAFKNVAAKRALVSELLKLLLQALAENGEIAYYNSNAGMGQCIFC